MKTIYLSLFLSLCIGCYSQNDFTLLKNPCTNLIETSENFKVKPSTTAPLSTNLAYDCNTVFWTVNISGEIQQWDLIGNQVTGGSVILNGSGTALSFCGSENDLTFYCTNYPTYGLKKYNTTTMSWDYISILITSPNSGGYYENKYFLNSSNTALTYYNPPIWITVPDSQMPLSDAYRVLDIAVDSLGRAWVFTGPYAGEYNLIETLRVFDTNGLVASYPLTTSISNNGAYGSFFLNDQLYIGLLNEIIPVNINGSVASLGTPISFPYNNYYDMASCNKDSSLGISNPNHDNLATVYPNPTNDILNIHLNEEILSLLVYSIDGKLIKTANNAKSIDISDLAKSTYLLKVISDKNVYNKFVVKE